MAAPTIVFNAELAKSESKKIPTSIVTLPKSAAAKLPNKAAVEGIFQGFPFRGSLDKGVLQITKAILDTTKTSVGETVQVEITRVDGESEIRVPADLAKALAASPAAKEQWAQITPNARRDWVLSI